MRSEEKEGDTTGTTDLAMHTIVTQIPMAITTTVRQNDRKQTVEDIEVLPAVVRAEGMSLKRGELCEPQTVAPAPWVVTATGQGAVNVAEVGLLPQRIIPH